MRMGWLVSIIPGYSGGDILSVFFCNSSDSLASLYNSTFANVKYLNDFNTSWKWFILIAIGPNGLWNEKYLILCHYFVTRASVPWSWTPPRVFSSSTNSCYKSTRAPQEGARPKGSLKNPPAIQVSRTELYIHYFFNRDFLNTCHSKLLTFFKMLS